MTIKNVQNNKDESKESVNIFANTSYNKKVIVLFILSLFILPINSLNLSQKQKTNNYPHNISLSELSSLISERNQSLSSEKNLKNFTGSELRSINILGGGKNEAKIVFGCQNNFFSFNLREQAHDFVFFNKAYPIFIASNNNELMLFPTYLKSDKDVNFTGQFKIRSIPQWRLIYEEDFSANVSGWSKNVVTECGGITMLGGYCQFGAGEVTKTFENIPEHKNIRIEATYHFIDAWNNEVGFMRINNGKNGEMQYAWIDNYSAFVGDNGVNVCGGKWPEGKFSVPINVSIPHKNKSIKISFGSTTEQDPCDQSFGVSGVRVYIK